MPSSGASARTVGARTRTAGVDDTVGPVTVDFLRVEIEAEFLAHHTREEAADRVLLPMGGAHDGSNRRTLRAGQHREHPGLFQARPAFAERHRFGLLLSRSMLFT